MLVAALFAVPPVAAAGLLGLCVLSFRRGGQRFWPPDRPDSAEARLFLGLYRLMIAACLAASVFAYVSEPAPVWRQLVGLALAAIGFGAGAAIITGMGWRGSVGAAEGLRIEGAFAISRNPTYLAHWLGLAGWALAVSSWAVAAALAFWAMSYALMAWLEEPWLETRYGDAYRAYRARVPRFL